MTQERRGVLVSDRIAWLERLLPKGVHVMSDACYWQHMGGFFICFFVRPLRSHQFTFCLSYKSGLIGVRTASGFDHLAPATGSVV